MSGVGLQVVDLDRNAAAPVHPAAWAAYAAAAEHIGAPEALHAAGQSARLALRQAQVVVAAALGAAADDIVWTSGGTEADALALATALPPADGAANSLKAAANPSDELPHVVCSGLEHAGVYATLSAWAQAGRLRYTQVPARRDGRMAVADVMAAVQPQTRLVSCTLACNETGALQPLQAIAQACRARGVAVHTDAVQAAGRVPLNVEALGVDLLSLSGHKLGAVGGIGVLWVHPAVRRHPLIAGGPEANLPGVAGLAAAMAHLPDAAHWDAVAAQRDALEAWAQRTLPCDVEVLAGAVPRLPNTSCLRLVGLPAEALMMALDVTGFAVSTGSACSSGTVEPSPLLLGMGLDAKQAQQALRLSWGAPLPQAQLHDLQAALLRAATALCRAA